MIEYPGTRVLRNKFGVQDAWQLERIVYDWAGEFRTVEIFKGGSSFSRPENIRDDLDALGDRLLDCDIKCLSKRDLAKHLATVLVELNHIHPFREGNGRVQRVVVGQMAVDVGYRLDWSVFNENIMRTASIMASRGDLRKFELYLRDGLKLCASEE